MLTGSMKTVQAIVFRYLTDADFFNIYKPRGSELRGGGQTYIDFSTRDVPVAKWKSLLAGVKGVVRTQVAQGPLWEVPVDSIGISPAAQQRVSIFQRRPASVAIGRQRLGSRKENRVQAWHPDNGFPKPTHPSRRNQCPSGLAVYLVRCTDGTVWAGWLLNNRVRVHGALTAQLGSLLKVPGPNDPRAGLIEIRGSSVSLDETSIVKPFRSVGTAERETDEPRSFPSPDDQGPRQNARATDGQGKQLDPKRRKAVEAHAMMLAKRAYPGAEDTSASYPFDLRWQENGCEVRVEVKGTLGSGEHVLVTANEVANAVGTGWRTDLFIVSEIELLERDDNVIARGGAQKVVRGWKPTPTDLTPTQYRCRVPPRE